MYLKVSRSNAFGLDRSNVSLVHDIGLATKYPDHLLLLVESGHLRRDEIKMYFGDESGLEMAKSMEVIELEIRTETQVISNPLEQEAPEPESAILRPE